MGGAYKDHPGHSDLAKSVCGLWLGVDAAVLVNLNMQSICFSRGYSRTGVICDLEGAILCVCCSPADSRRLKGSCSQSRVLPPSFSAGGKKKSKKKQKLVDVQISVKWKEQ